MTEQRACATDTSRAIEEISFWLKASNSNLSRLLALKQAGSFAELDPGVFSAAMLQALEQLSEAIEWAVSELGKLAVSAKGGAQ